MLKQCTIRNPITASGIGLHTGVPLQLKLYPAEPNTGIKVRRIDCKPSVEIPLKADHVTSTILSTEVGLHGATVSTVEHLLSALWGLGIDNVLMEIDGPEIPIMDGSAHHFIFLIQSAGIEEQPAPRNFLRVLKTLRIRQHDSWVRLAPYQGLKVSFTLDYNHPVLKSHRSKFSLDLNYDCYIREISRARTFGFKEELDTLQANNKALGASPHNAIALGDDQVLNDTALRYENEFTRHKILDAVGDLYMAGYPILGHFTGYKSGHSLNNLLVRKLMQNEDNWELVTFNSREEAMHQGLSLWQLTI